MIQIIKFSIQDMKCDLTIMTYTCKSRRGEKREKKSIPSCSNRFLSSSAGRSVWEASNICKENKYLDEQSTHFCIISSFRSYFQKDTDNRRPANTSYTRTSHNHILTIYQVLVGVFHEVEKHKWPKVSCQIWSCFTWGKGTHLLPGTWPLLIPLRGSGTAPSNL